MPCCCSIQVVEELRMSCDPFVPATDALSLHLFRGQEAVHALITSHQPLAHQGINNRMPSFRTSESLIEIRCGREEIEGTSLTLGCNFLEELQVRFLLFGHIVDVRHIGIKLDREAEVAKDDGKQSHHHDQPLLPFYLNGSEAGEEIRTFDNLTI